MIRLNSSLDFVLILTIAFNKIETSQIQVKKVCIYTILSYLESE